MNWFDRSTVLGALFIAGAASAQAPIEPPAAVVGPPAAATPENPTSADRRYASFGGQTRAVGWELAGLLAYTTVSQAIVTKDTRSFHFQDEGWFGKSTANLGLDKLAHAHNTYLISEILYGRINRKAGGDAPGSALTAALLASGVSIYSELWDAHKVSSGFSYQDVLFNTAGAGFSVLRNTVPGLKEKLDFRLMIIPNSDIYTFKGKEHYRQQRYLFALTLAGFDRLRDGPLRFVELHAGYYGKGFTNRERARGDRPQRKLFVGVGLNLGELFFRNARSGAGRLAGQVLDYYQVPYTAVHVD